MTPERQDQVKAWCTHLANLSPEQRREELEQIGADDPSLRREIETRLTSRDIQKSMSVPSVVPEQRRDRIGQTISHYRIDQKLGGGGMGIVYKAQDLRLDRAVALKFLPPTMDDDDERLKRLIVEARAASALDHPNICTIHQIDQTHDGHWFIVMAYYDGDTLKRRIERSPMPVLEVLDIGIQVAHGLVKAHKEGIVHRDLKPANLMVTTEQVVKIVDFGLAQLHAQTKLTAPGTRLGTPAYMSPEQAQGQPLDQRTDIWSMGVVLYEMLAGRPPFKGEYELAVIYSIVNEEPTPINQLRDDTPDPLAHTIQKALSKDPADRHHQMTDLLEELQSLKSELRSASQSKRKSSASVVLPPPAPVRSRKRVLAVVIAAVVALVAAAFMLQTSRQTLQPSSGSVVVTETPAQPATPDSQTPSDTASRPDSDTATDKTETAAIAEPPASSTVGSNAAPPPAPALPPVVTPPTATQPPATQPPAATNAPVAERPVPARLTIGSVREWPPENQRWALIIGVEQYADSGITAFRGAARDAVAIEEALVRYAGFAQDQVIVLASSEPQMRRPTRANLESYIENVAELVPREGLLLFCFLGHALPGNNQPLLLPSDARLDRNGNPGSSGVNLDRLRSAVTRRGIRQVMVLFDGFRQSPRASQAGAANPMNDAYSRRLSFETGRQLEAYASLFAAAPGERSYDRASGGGGYFASAVVEALKGSAADERGRTTLAAFDRYVRSAVPKRVMGDQGARAVQRPFSMIEGYRPEEVVIATVARRELTVAEPAVQQQAMPVNSAAQELVEWTRVRESHDIAVVEEFLRQYPNGSLRREAQSRIEDLKWETARAATNPAVIESYLRDNPNTRYISQARARLEELRPPPPPVPAPAPVRPAPEAPKQEAPKPEVKAEAPRLPAEADAVRDALKRFGAAYRSRDVNQVAAVWPTLTAEQLRRLANSFRIAVSIQQDLIPLSDPVIRGDEAIVRCRRSSRYEDERGPQKPVDENVDVTLHKRQGVWVIDSMR